MPKGRPTLLQLAIILLWMAAYWIPATHLFGQSLSERAFSYRSPLDSAGMVNPESCILFRLNPSVSKEFLFDSLQLEVVGSISKVHSGKLSLATDGETIRFKPDYAFASGERVEVSAKWSANMPAITYGFDISSTPKDYQHLFLEEWRQKPFDENIPSGEDNIGNQLNNKHLPVGLPNITITHNNNPSPGYFFLGTISNKSRGDEFLAMYDNLANPVFYRKLPNNTPSDFKIQQNGNLSYHGRTNWEFYEMNPYFEVIDTIRAANGMLADNHELIITPDNHKFLLVHDVQLVDMSVIVPGGNPAATVIGLVVQELDENDELVFQWRSWDHFEITDAAYRINLQGSIIDYVHGNSIDIDSDTTMVISSRNMDEVTRINRQTGEIIWRLGGKRNEFAFADSTQMFCHQHDARIMGENNRLSVFDNGNCHSPRYSSAAEYLLDFDQMTATLMNRLRSSPDIYGSFMGNAQRLANGRTVVGWGSGIPSITEFDEAGDIALEFSFNNINYRAFKFNWQSPILTSDVDTVVFDTIHQYDSILAQVLLTNNFDENLIINEVFFHNTGFLLGENLPVTIAPGESKTFALMFKPTEVGDYTDVVTFCQDTDTDDLTQRIAHQVVLVGKATIQSDVLTHAIPSDIRFFPNPFSNEINIRSNHSDLEQVCIYDGMGQLVSKGKYDSADHVQLEVDLPSGIYLLVVKTKSGLMWRERMIGVDKK